jgi:hypothetical protein
VGVKVESVLVGERGSDHSVSGESEGKGIVSGDQQKVRKSRLRDGGKGSADDRVPSEGYKRCGASADGETVLPLPEGISAEMMGLEPTTYPTYGGIERTPFKSFFKEPKGGGKK